MERFRQKRNYDPAKIEKRIKEIKKLVKKRKDEKWNKGRNRK